MEWKKGCIFCYGLVIVSHALAFSSEMINAYWRNYFAKRPEFYLIVGKRYSELLAIA